MSLNHYSNLNGMLTAKTWLPELLLLLGTKTLSLLQSHMKRHGIIGLKIFKTGASQDNFGGVTEFQFTLLQLKESLIIQISTIMITTFVEEMKQKLNKLQLRSSKLMSPKFQCNKMKMFWIHGSPQDCSHSL